MITIIKGPPNSGKSLLANALRNTAIGGGRGVLLIDDHAEGEAERHLERIIAGDPFMPGTPIEDIRWKSDPQIILVNSGAGRLAEFEALVPGFTAKFGPVSTINIGQAA
jgi:hypothetical protein